MGQLEACDVLDGEITDESLHPDFFQVCGVDAKTGELIAKCVNVTPKARPLDISFAGGSEFKSEVPAYSLTVFRFKTR